MIRPTFTCTQKLTIMQCFKLLGESSSKLKIHIGMFIGRFGP